ncbi:MULTISPECIES: relaxase/mobilization nuclease domain-containing protein [unclassified Shinella]|uniref:relaxase/mobilization nuclease domain-containing protein n=1 Tax=unclassified Shinella TaxID=2643062 RepID=UPI00234E472C|nr:MULTISPECIES: hypothetical protein [unclassified Shinella]MCO5152830.1 hypothetical protein [Shinella sp.]MDC7260822.1 hypothetical protein [Shinella sp. HY16]MDC7267717.1 hypothetical protein [Shinella sp. YZ44]
MSMIIKGIRLRSSSSIGRTIRHLENGDENEAVDYVAGTAADIRDMHRDAVSIGSRYAVRHWIIAPHESTTRQQMTKIVGAIAKEFAFDPARAVIVEHQKKRSTKDAVDVHWHVLVGEVDPASGRILATSYDRIRHELIARMAEFAFGHAIVPGKHTEAVVKGLRKRGLNCVADRVEEFIAPAQTVAAEAFTHARHQECKRLGLDLPALKQAIKASLNTSSNRDGITSTLAELRLEAKAGDKPGTWIVVDSQTGTLIGALHRLSGLRKSAINDLMGIGQPEEQPEDRAVIRVTPPSDLQTVRSQLSKIAPANAAGHLEELITELEQSARLELERMIPAFKPTAAMEEAKQAASHADKDLSDVVMQRTALDIQIANVSPVRWWHRLSGLAGRRQREVIKLETALKDIEVEILRKEIAFTKCRQREVREERAAKERHVATVSEIVQRQERAREALAVLQEARHILADKPEIAIGGMDAILSAAKTRIRNADAIAGQIDELTSATRHRS